MQRIISLVPSQTELLYDLGLNDEVVGITKFCIHPAEWFRSRTRVGGTKTVDIAKVRSLKPSLILANKEENVKEQIETLQQFASVHVSDIANLDDALEMISDIGKLVGREEKAAGIINKVAEGFNGLGTFNKQHAIFNVQDKNELQRQSSKQKRLAAYLIWRDPYMAAGGDTFINDMLERCGFKNVYANTTRYPEVTIEQLSSNNCQLLLLSSEPYPFKQKHIDEIQQQLPNTKIMLVDGEMFSWYGSRLLHAPAYFTQLLKQLQP
jgi:ABC-type Fe3+-hydroxamate transport system substrate-binding protein